MGEALDTRIYVPGGHEEAIGLAAAELSRLLAKVTNRRVPVLHSPPPSPMRRRRTGCEIVVMPVSSKATTSQGYAIRSAAGRVEVVGMDRAGVLQAAYAFLS